MDDLKCINVKGLAALTGLGQQSIRQAISDKTGSRKLKLPQITRLGASVRFRMDHVRTWLNSNGGQTGPSDTPSVDPLPTVESRKPMRGRPRKVAASGSAA